MKQTTKTVLSAVFIALGLTIPFLTAQMQDIGNAFLPMHIPVLLCGLFCGTRYGAAVGFILPLLRSFWFSMPPMYPVAVCMAFELCTYGAVAGFLADKKPGIGWRYMTLITAMLSGRLVWGIVSAFVWSIGGQTFTFHMFLAGAFLEAVPGIVIQLVLIPVLVQAIQKVRKHKGKL